MQSQEDVRRFDEAVQQVTAQDLAKADAREFLRAFDDRTRHPEVMWGLVHLVEAIPGERLVEALFQEAGTMGATAGEWLQTLLLRHLNHPDASQWIVRRWLQASVETRAAMIDAMSSIAKSSARGAPIAAELLAHTE